MSSDGRRPRAVIFGCSGTVLTDAEAAFFQEADPLGFILFARNCKEPERIAALTAALRNAVGRADAPVLIDQEGGRVARLRPPHWRALPAAGRIAALSATDPERARAIARWCGRLAAADLAPLGIDVDCAPVADVLDRRGHPTAIGDRAFGTDPAGVAALARAWADGLQDGGVLPVVKHIPGHGRATADSHFALPVVDAGEQELYEVDIAAFRALRDLPMAMTAHVLYPVWDPLYPATLSPHVIRDVVRGLVGFDGLLISDDLSMKALGGPIGRRAADALYAGCDVALHCNGDPGEMAEIATAAGLMSTAAWARWRRARAGLRPPAPVDLAAAPLDEIALLCTTAGV